MINPFSNLLITPNTFSKCINVILIIIPNGISNTQTLENKARVRDKPYLNLPRDAPKSKGLSEKLLNEFLGTW